MELHIFDLDETLINGDSGALWHRYLVEQGIVTEPDFLAQDAAMMQQYALGELALERYIEFSLAPLQYYSQQQVDDWVTEFVDNTISPIIYPAGQALIQQLQQQHQVIIISATVSFIVKQIAAKLSVKHYLGVDLVGQQGRYTPTIDGVASYQEGKVTRLQQWLQQQPISYSKLRFYSDSINDRPLLEHVDHAYVVNPCAKLRPLARKRQWPILSWDLN
ncbi:HAD family hydrolase [Agarivorans gilvus]|uniref:Haloacid dehalogenase n=1 Tax=Agarivorans gilvus TaxID=680279 RepID=A0ABQ1I4J4_9ALTE|nr:HAD family hydrolase [Agarivorans gilvus]GGB15646.1 haloacid dehalogenase [Agarivorans gilvus]